MPIPWGHLVGSLIWSFLLCEARLFFCYGPLHYYYLFIFIYLFIVIFGYYFIFFEKVAWPYDQYLLLFVNILILWQVSKLHAAEGLFWTIFI